MHLKPTFDGTGSPELLSISVVTYRPSRALLERTLETLDRALLRLTDETSDVRWPLFLIANGPAEDVDWTRTRAYRRMEGVVVEGQGNVGYGRGHNLAVQRTHARFHLILNPDIELDDDALVRAIGFLEEHPEVGVVTPRIVDETGRQQFLCRRYPAVLDLFVRGFLPSGLRRLFDTRLARYEMRDVIDDTDVVWDPPIVSGCFMLFRTDVLKRLGGFDPRYFLYFEDYDLSLRTHDIAHIAYVPSVRVLHHGGDAARKGLKHIRLFSTSAFRFFNRFGWKWL